MNSCQPVTALFDINRELNDGRSMSDYIAWLIDTIKIFPDLIIFHDGCCDDISLISSSFVKINRDDLWIFQQNKAISEIIENFNYSAQGDITFLNPLYSQVQFAKFELLALAQLRVKAKSYLWIDAGISRFIEIGGFFDKCNKNSKLLLDNKIDYVFEIDLRNNLSLSQLAISYATPGTCRRVISGTSFWVAADSVPILKVLVKREILSWIDLQIWDNEQVLLRDLVPNLTRVSFIIQWHQETGSVARNFISKNLKVIPLINWTIRKLMMRNTN